METVKTVTIVKTVKVDRPLKVGDLIERERQLLYELRDNFARTFEDMRIIGEDEIAARDETCRANLNSTDPSVRRRAAEHFYRVETLQMCLDKGIVQVYHTDGTNGVRQRRIKLTDIGTRLADKLPRRPWMY